MRYSLCTLSAVLACLAADALALPQLVERAGPPNLISKPKTTTSTETGGDAVKAIISNPEDPWTDQTADIGAALDLNVDASSKGAVASTTLYWTVKCGKCNWKKAERETFATSIREIIFHGTLKDSLTPGLRGGDGFDKVYTSTSMGGTFSANWYGERPAGADARTNELVPRYTREVIDKVIEIESERLAKVEEAKKNADKKKVELLQKQAAQAKKMGLKGE